MKILKIVAVLIAVLISLFFIIKKSNERVLEPLSCDLAKMSCSYENVLFSATPAPVLPMQKSQIIISGLDKNLKSPSINFIGENMYMGEISSPLKPDKDGNLKANFILPSCSEKVMRYRVEIFNKNSPTGIFTRLDLVNF